MASITIRLDDDTRDAFNEAAQRRGQTLSEFAREALDVAARVNTPEDSDDDFIRNISLSMMDRKVLQMLHRILLSTQGDLAEEYYDKDSEVKSLTTLEHGFESEYPQEFSDLYEPMSRAEGELVWDIFDMFRILKYSVEEIGGWGTIDVEDAEEIGTFAGFDLNNETEARLLDYGRYLVKTGRWVEQAESFSNKNDRGNSHTEMLGLYRRLLQSYKPLYRASARGGSYLLSKENIEKVLRSAT